MKNHILGIIMIFLTLDPWILPSQVMYIVGKLLAESHINLKLNFQSSIMKTLKTSLTKTLSVSCVSSVMQGKCSTSLGSITKINAFQSDMKKHA